MSSWIIHLLAFIAAISLLVTVHEFGHYWVARRLGFKVLRFSIGFGKALWTRVAGEDATEYVIAAVPLGGYVKMLDEREGPVDSAELSRSFTRRPHWQRIAVLLAGPAFNIGFAIILLTAVYLISGVNQVRPVLGPVDPTSILGQAGFRAGDEITAIDSRPVDSEDGAVLGLLDAVSGNAPIVLSARDGSGAVRSGTLDVPPGAARVRLTEPEAMLPSLGLRFYEPPAPAAIGEIDSNGPAARAGLATGDQLLAVDGEPVHDWQDLQTRIEAHPNASILIRYLRAGVESSVRVQSESDTVNGKVVGRIRIAQQGRPLPPSMIRHINLSIPSAFAHATVDAWDMTALQGRLFWRMLIGQVSMKNLSGPLSIAQYAGDSAVLGLLSFLRFLVIVSLALGFMNLLPIPILDGGQIVFQTIEWLKGSPLSERFQMIGQQLGMALLVLLMGVALFNDISRQFG
ncbi:MAG TPA: RIP metalloprotease RseP [Steroidobacteraceae bacterium]|jgi:regulator of sigma E protease|nr:RIP metalloprotease RseP [Steroidobacteraceae bacterium]